MSDNENYPRTTRGFPASFSLLQPDLFDARWKLAEANLDPPSFNKPSIPFHRSNLSAFQPNKYGTSRVVEFPFVARNDGTVIYTSSTTRNDKRFSSRMIIKFSSKSEEIIPRRSILLEDLFDSSFHSSLPPPSLLRCRGRRHRGKIFRPELHDSRRRFPRQ